MEEQINNNKEEIQQTENNIQQPENNAQQFNGNGVSSETKTSQATDSGQQPKDNKPKKGKDWKKIAIVLGAVLIAVVCFMAGTLVSHKGTKKSGHAITFETDSKEKESEMEKYAYNLGQKLQEGNITSIVVYDTDMKQLKIQLFVEGAGATRDGSLRGEADALEVWDLMKDTANGYIDEVGGDFRKKFGDDKSIAFFVYDEDNMTELLYENVDGTDVVDKVRDPFG